MEKMRKTFKRLPLRCKVKILDNEKACKVGSTSPTSPTGHRIKSPIQPKQAPFEFEKNTVFQTRTNGMDTRGYFTLFNCKFLERLRLSDTSIHTQKLFFIYNPYIFSSIFLQLFPNPFKIYTHLYPLYFPIYTIYFAHFS